MGRRLQLFGIAIGLAIGLSSLMPQARALEGDQFFTMCANKSNPGDKEFCLGYVFAIAEALFAVPDRTVCFEGVSPEVLLDAVVSHMANLPEPRGGTAGAHVAGALEVSFPCQ